MHSRELNHPVPVLGVALALAAVVAFLMSPSPAASSRVASAANLRSGGVLGLVPGSSGPFHRASRFGVVDATNWAGYVLVGTTGTFTAVQDTWTVPSVAAKGKKYSSDWVGIGGAVQGDTTLVQAGTEADSLGHGQVLYRAWTEVLPAAEDPLSLAVSPGDRITVLVKETSPDVWLLQLTDSNSGTQSRTISYASSGASVEVVHERPTLLVRGRAKLGGLAVTSNVAFDPGLFSTSAPGSNSPSDPMLVPLSTTTLYESIMFKNSRLTKPLATPSPADGDNDGFSVADGALPPGPPSS